MELIKKTLFIIIPITTLLIALAYGIEIIFGINITYLGTTINGTYYPNIYDFPAYLKNLNAEDIIQPFINLGQSTQILLEPINDIKNLVEEGNFFQQVIGIVANIIILLLDTLLFAIDIIMAILQCILVILGKTISLFGINTQADVELFNVMRTITNFQIGEGIPGWTKLGSTGNVIVQPGYIPIKF